MPRSVAKSPNKVKRKRNAKTPKKSVQLTPFERELVEQYEAVLSGKSKGQPIEEWKAEFDAQIRERLRKRA